MREDYSADGNCWDYFPHDHARSRAYRWGEDGLLGICDRQGRLCFALALWNGRDPILKERLFGLTGPEGNHGEDVKELYYYLDSTPTHSYLKALYKYPAGASFPTSGWSGEPRPRQAGARVRAGSTPACSTTDRYFDVFAEYAKAAPDDILIRITVANRGPEAASLHRAADALVSQHLELGPRGRRLLAASRASPRADRRRSWPSTQCWVGTSCEAEAVDGAAPELLFTENETNVERALRRAERAAVREGRVSSRRDRGRDATP